jgi:Holliday junction resolvasome RuvABC ATP-dependent DNA helicase subunit
MGAREATSGPMIEKRRLAGLLTNIERGEFFIDEIHRLRPLSRILCPAMEDFNLL